MRVERLRLWKWNTCKTMLPSQYCYGHGTLKLAEIAKAFIDMCYSVIIDGRCDFDN